MEKELYFEKQYPVRHDDLKFNGKEFIIPGNWADTIYDLLSNVNAKNVADSDKEDLNALKNFFSDVISYKKSNGLTKSKPTTYHFEDTN